MEQGMVSIRIEAFDEGQQVFDIARREPELPHRPMGLLQERAQAFGRVGDWVR